MEFLEMREMDIQAFDEDAKLFALYNQEVKGLYTAKDSSKLLINQNLFENITNPGIQFRVCNGTTNVECAPKEEIE